MPQMAYCIIASFAPAFVFIHVKKIRPSDTDIPRQLRLLRDKRFVDHPAAAQNPNLVDSKYYLDRCQRCGKRVHTICFSLLGRGRSGSGKCYPCKSQDCDKFRNLTQDHRDDLAALYGAGIANAPAGSAIEQIGQRVLDHHYVGRK